MRDWHRWWRGLGSFIMIVGMLGGCSEGTQDTGANVRDVCLLIGEREPNATALTAQFLDDVFAAECFIVTGRIVDPLDVDSYRILIHESLTLAVTLDHSPLVDFDLQLFDAETGQLIRDCGLNVVPEVCAVSFVVRARALLVDVVVTSFLGAGSYTLTLDTH